MNSLISLMKLEVCKVQWHATRINATQWGSRLLSTTCHLVRWLSFYGTRVEACYLTWIVSETVHKWGDMLRSVDKDSTWGYKCCITMKIIVNKQCTGKYYPGTYRYKWAPLLPSLHSLCRSFAAAPHEWIHCYRSRLPGNPQSDQ